MSAQNRLHRALGLSERPKNSKKDELRLKLTKIWMKNAKKREKNVKNAKKDAILVYITLMEASKTPLGVVPEVMLEEMVGAVSKNHAIFDQK